MYRINCGSNSEYVDGNMVKWLPDQTLEPGGTWGAIGGGVVKREKDLIIHEKVAPELYRSERFGATGYEFSVPNGTYTVRLHFSECHESNFAPGLRVFDVNVGPGLALKDFDPYKETGGFAVPVIMVFSGRTVTDGKLRIGFTAKSDSTCINGIEILKSEPAKPRVTREASPALPLPVRSIEPPPGAKAGRILFIGNSLTIRWDLPNTIQGMINSGPSKLRIRTFRSVAGGRNLEWHYNLSEAVNTIRNGGYDDVVLQEYAVISTPEKMLDMVGKFDHVIRESGARTLIYCTWVASDKTLEDQDSLNRTQLDVARKLNDTFVPAGPAWLTVRRDRPDINLYNPDKGHPSLNGSYLTACVFYGVLTGQTPVGNAFTAVGGGQVEVDKQVASYLQQVAWATVRKCANP